MIVSTLSANPAPPHLAPPGAGLPWIELQVARLIFRWSASRSTREKSAQLLSREASAVLELARACDETTGSQRVLITRLPGMEDSSRFWSVFMTLEHLRIVNRAVAHTIEQLGHGQIPAGEATTASVKPAPYITRAVITEFEASCRAIEQQVRRLPDLKTKARYRHPWFGPLDAAQWYFVSGFHLQLHHRQILAILRHLGR